MNPYGLTLPSPALAPTVPSLVAEPSSLSWQLEWLRRSAEADRRVAIRFAGEVVS